MDTTDTVLLLIWGHGASALAAIRSADSDANYVDAAIARTLGGRAERDEETGEWMLRDDAWCVAIDPTLVSTADLDRDPAVVGYREFATNGC